MRFRIPMESDTPISFYRIRLEVIAFLVLFLATPTLEQRPELPREFIEFVERQENVVKEVARQATQLFSDRINLVRNCECSRHACSNDFLEAGCYTHMGTPDICSATGHFGRRIDYDLPIFRLPPGVDERHIEARQKESICVYRNLEELAKSYYTVQEGDATQGEGLWGWVFVGTRDGHFWRYPGTARRRGVGYEENSFECRSYDPRIRPWYIGASTGPKDVVLVVDKSGSMIDGEGSPTKWDLVVNAVHAILDSFTNFDYVNVVVFNSQAEALWTESGLVRASSENGEELKAALSDVVVEGHTNFAAAFSKAFELLADCQEEPSTCSNCQKIILFLTDGEDQSREGEAIKPSEMSALIDDLQENLREETGKRASIFTFSMSEHADDGIPRQIACANNGAWSLIQEGTNPLEALASYYLYISAGRRNSEPIWTEIYENSSDLGNVTTVAMPFFAEGVSGVEDVFLGVAGHMVSLHEIGERGVEPETALNFLTKRIARLHECRISPDTQCKLQVYRNAADSRSVCADPFPVIRNSPTSRSSPPACYQNELHWYRRFTEEVSWVQARTECSNDGGQLVSIRDGRELAFLANLASIDGSWIGASRNSTIENTFGWIDSSIPELLSNSSFWSVQGPRDRGAGGLCVAIDNRGVSGNLRTRTSCSERLSFICKYDDASHCSNIVELPSEGYYKVPPVQSCLFRESFDASQPIPLAKNLTRDRIICRFGEARISNTQAICCADFAGVTNPIAHTAWIVIGIAIAIWLFY